MWLYRPEGRRLVRPMQELGLHFMQKFLKDFRKKKKNKNTNIHFLKDHPGSNVEKQLKEDMNHC